MRVAIKELKNLIIQGDLLIAYDISFRIFSLNKKEVLDEVKMQKDLDLLHQQMCPLMFVKIPYLKIYIRHNV